MKSKKNHKTRNNKTYKNKRIFKSKNNKTYKKQKYVGSGPFDKIITPGLTKFKQKQNKDSLTSVSRLFTGTNQSLKPNFNATPLISNINTISNIKMQEDIKKRFGTVIGKNPAIKPKLKSDSLFDTINTKPIQELKIDIKKKFNKLMNEYDKISDPVYNVEMNEYGRYPAFFKKVPENMRKPGDIEPYLNQGEESWKSFKQARGVEEFLRQSKLHKKMYKKEDDEEKKEDDEEKKEDDEEEKITDIADFVKKSTETQQLKMDISNLGRSIKIGAPIPIFTQLYISDLIKNGAFQSKFNAELDTIFKKIRNVNLREKVIEYNNQTISQENIGFIGWTKAAALTGYNMLSPSKDYIIKKTAQSVAIAKTNVVNNYIVKGTYNTLFRALPVGIKTTYGLLDWGLLQSIAAMISMTNEKLDWTKTENLDQYNKNLTITLDVVLPVLLKDLTNQGCNKALINISKRVINPITVTKIASSIQEKTKTNVNFSQLADSSTDFCNKILPIISEQFKKHGFSKGIGDNARDLLNNYLDTSLSLAKDILWDFLKNNTRAVFEEIDSDIDVSIESNFIYDPEMSETDLQNLRRQYNDIFQGITLKIIANKLNEKASEIRNFLSSTINKETIKTKVTYLLHKPFLPEIQEGEEEIKDNLVNFTQDKVKISEFITNLGPSIQKLLILWNKEIHKQGVTDEFSSVDCLLNVLDIRINTLLDETCKVYAKSLLPKELCSKKFIDLVSIFYTKPLSDVTIDDVKNSIKNIIINFMVKNIQEKTLYFGKTIEKVFGNYTDAYFTLDYMVIN